MRQPLGGFHHYQVKDSMGPTPGHTIRPITPADEPLLWKALYHAIYVAPGDTPPERDIVNRPELARYVRGWGDANDLGFLGFEIDSTSGMSLVMRKAFV